MIDTFVRATPYNYRHLRRIDGDVLEFEISGDAGGKWFLQRRFGSWDLSIKVDRLPSVSISIPQDTFWRLFTKGMPPAQAKTRATVHGDAALAEPFFQTVAVLA